LLHTFNHAVALFSIIVRKLIPSCLNLQFLVLTATINPSALDSCCLSGTAQFPITQASRGFSLTLQ